MPRYVLQGWGDAESLNFMHQCQKLTLQVQSCLGFTPQTFTAPSRRVGWGMRKSSPLKLREACTYPQAGIADADALYTAEILPLRRGSAW